ncbi:MAG TPA: hypothetical protein VHY09_11360 [Candidatus Methylacidiphilales bacterium]|jgi:hypothetical protein|nr:hypothetical protein [Candidatus Methylacidiphilales bacterium]
MKHYDFPQHFAQLYDKAVALYAKGQRGASTYFDKDEAAWLASNGITPQHIYDYAEDANNGGEPGFGHAVLIESARHNYFINVQHGKPSGVVLDEAKLPAKTDKAKGIEWLPRIIPKAKAKLRGELPDSLMYCCGGDRRFFKAHDILPSELLGAIWRNIDNDAAVVDWVVARSKAANG